MTGQSDRDFLEGLFVGHMPVVEICPQQHVHPRGCSCGNDPLDMIEHLVNLITAAGFTRPAETPRDALLAACEHISQLQVHAIDSPAFLDGATAVKDAAVGILRAEADARTGDP